MTAVEREPRLPGRATANGTARLARRIANAAPGHFRGALGLTVSSIGLGTYLGDPDAETDAGYQESLRLALSLGCNVIDTAVNYRYQHSERAIGTVLRDLIGGGGIRRDEIVVCTKGGYLSFDGPPADPRGWVEKTFIEPGIIEWGDIVAYNVMHPRYIRHEIDRSLENLGLGTIDVYYLHNPESQLEGIDRAGFLRRMAACFEELERAVAEGLIGIYGAATWSAFRVEPSDPSHVSLDDLLRTARAVAGDGHHFGAVQLPFNLAMTEAVTKATQMAGDTLVPTLEAAWRAGLAVFASGSLLQGRLATLPPGVADVMPDLASDAQRALQFVRSTPGIAAALVGMKTPEHVRENLTLARRPLQPAGFPRPQA